MSTRSRIGLLQNDGTVRSIYCHQDGYLEGVGKCLVENYVTVEQVSNLLTYGNLDYLGSTPADSKQLAGGDWNMFGSGVVPFLSQTSNDNGEVAYLFKEGRWYFWELDKLTHELWDMQAEPEFTPVPS